MQYNKLVRDRIPDIIKSKGGNPTIHIADSDELRKRLADKLYEEVREFLNDWNVQELADISEVIRAFSEAIGSSPQQVEWVRQKKAQEKGGFSGGIVLDEA